MKTQYMAIGIVIILVVFGSVVVLLSTTTGKVTSETIKIGSILPLTGEAAEIGLRAQEAFGMATEEINAQGGINGKKLEIIYEDGRCNAKAAAEAANKLINIDKVQVILGGLCSGETMAAAPIAEQNKVVLLSSCSSAPKVSDAGDFIFRDMPSDTFQGSFGAEYVYNTLGIKKVAILHTIGDYGNGIKDEFKKKFLELGGQIVAEESFEQDATDMRAQLTKIKALKPELIYMPAYPQGVALALKQAKELGITSKLLGSDGSDDPTIIKLAGEGAEGFRFTVPTPGYEKFTQRFKEKFGHDVIICTSYSYDAANILAQVLKKAGNNAEAIKNELYKIKDFKGETGIIGFDKNGDRLTSAYVIKEVKNGQFVVMKPKEKGTITIGFIGPLSGDAANFGISEKNAIEMALNEINSKGGINGKDMKVIYEDGKCNGKDAVIAAQKLVNVDNVKVILGGACSSETLAVAPITEKSKVILHSAFSSNPAITDAGEYVFRTSPSDIETGRFAAEKIIKKYKNVAILTENTDYAQGARKVFKEKFMLLDGKIVADEVFSQGDRDFRTQILKIKVSNAEAIFFVPQSGTTQGLAIKQIRDVGINTQIYTVIAATDAIDIAGNAIEGTLIVDSPGLSTTGDVFLEKYKQTYASDPVNEYDAGARYDSVFIIANALRNCGEDTDCIKNFLYSMDWYNGIIGRYKFDSNGDVAGIDFEFKIVKNGTFVLYNE